MKPYFYISFNLVLILIINPPIYTQPVIEPPKLTDGNNFGIIQKELNDYYKENPTAKGYKQWKRKEWFLEPRLFPGGEIENLTLKTWKAYDRYMREQPGDRSTHGSWSFLGPTSCEHGLGRLNAIAFHSSNSNIMYVGSSNGGVWKTSDGGSSWINVSPVIPLLSVADVKLSPTNSNVVYLLTGDGDPDVSESNAHGQSEVSSIGILRSTDAGATWYPTNFSFIHPSPVVPTKLAIHPTDVNIQFVASEDGIYRTTDHWATWDIALDTVVYDIEFKPGDPDVLYAGLENKIFRTINGGDNWDQITDSDFSQMAQATRVELAVAPNNAGIVYAMAGNLDGFEAFFESQTGGGTNSWVLRNNTATTIGLFADYCIALVVDPNDWTDVFGGMQWINRSLNQGTTWTSIVDDLVHADVHDVAYRNGALWVCCDGGLYKSTDEGDTWTDLSPGLAITEVYRIAGTPQDNNRYFLGCQDNGTMRRDGPTSAFDYVNPGDGMTCLIDYTDIDVVYASAQNGRIYKSTNGGDGFSELSIPGGEGAWISPMIMDQVNHERLFVGTTEVYRSDDEGDDWSNVFAPTTMDLINCLAQGTSNQNRLYASSDDLIYRCDNALGPPGYNWTSIGGGLPEHFITGIAVDPNNSSRVFVSLSGYTDGEKVYRSNNAGVDWTNLSGSLPDVPINCIEFHENGLNNDALYIGTDIGVFYRDNDIGDWIYFSNAMPAVNVNDLYINTGNNTIAAGTYGRGVWRSSLYDGCVGVLALTSQTGGVRYYSASSSISSSVLNKKDIGNEIHYKAGNHVLLVPGFEAGGNAFFHGKIGPCPDIISEPLMSPFSSSSRLVMEEQPKKPHSN